MPALQEIFLPTFKAYLKFGKKFHTFPFKLGENGLQLIPENKANTFLAKVGMTAHGLHIVLQVLNVILSGQRVADNLVAIVIIILNIAYLGFRLDWNADQTLLQLMNFIISENKSCKRYMQNCKVRIILL